MPQIGSDTRSRHGLCAAFRALGCVLALWVGLVLGPVAGMGPGSAQAQDNPFAPGWVLDREGSSLTFQSVKNGSKVETSTFASYEGSIAPDGAAEVRIQLDSVDTGVDLRNVRMRFLFFETFQHPEAVIRVALDPAMLDGLAQRRRMRVTLPYEMELHGMTQPLTVEAIVTLISDDLVSVASAAPISLATALFNLDEGVQKLQDAAKVTIVPSASVSFDFVFTRAPGAAEPVTAEAEPEAGRTPAPAPAPVVAAAAPVSPAAAPAQTALETQGEFSVAECAGRFEILSRAGAIYFASGSAALDPASDAFLRSIVDIIERCPKLEVRVEGHTDSIGGEGLNQRLSEARAASVTRYLVDSGVAETRLSHVGYGEQRPVAPNDTDRGRRLNRRIEFTIP